MDLQVQIREVINTAPMENPEDVVKMQGNKNEVRGQFRDIGELQDPGGAGPATCFTVEEGRCNV